MLWLVHPILLAGSGALTNTALKFYLFSKIGVTIALAMVVKNRLNPR